MQTETTKRGLRRALTAARADGKRIVLVPTMGYLHEGHLMLVDRARRFGDFVVMSIFVNPLQFGPREDLASYPRDLARDSALARERHVDLLFAPSAEEMYESGPPDVTVTALHLADKLCGHFRPGHFEGVLTVVAKLFNLVQPNVAVFGQKDFQQGMLVKRMCVDLEFATTIEIAPTVREPDGLAMSSRNVHLGPGERASALQLSRALAGARNLYRAGQRVPRVITQQALDILQGAAGVRVQYVELVDANTLDTPAQADDDSVLAMAAFVGTTRLIDNTRLGE